MEVLGIELGYKKLCKRHRESFLKKRHNKNVINFEAQMLCKKKALWGKRSSVKEKEHNKGAINLRHSYHVE